ncbi:MAG: hypothetical protein HC921_14365 [Synechococcaceae cyanobacterium SM2_3_1]|nr:hypothetical protein [Synechococcaceae cyanobacterium SM2_3_1]
MTNSPRPQKGRDSKIKTDHMGTVMQYLELGLRPLRFLAGHLRLSSHLPFLQVLYQRSFYIYLLWAASTFVILFPESDILQRQAGWVVLPLALNLVLVLGSARNYGVTLSQRVPRVLWGMILFALPFFQSVNVSGYTNRPFWACLALWLVGLLLILSVGLKSFFLGMTGLAILILSFMTLLF